MRRENLPSFDSDRGEFLRTFAYDPKSVKQQMRAQNFKQKPTTKQRMRAYISATKVCVDMTPQFEPTKRQAYDQVKPKG